jgi:hypothetical protein
LFGFSPKFVGIVLYLSQNEKRKIIIKSMMMKFRHLAFGLYYREMPGWYIKGNLSNVKKTNINEYFLNVAFRSKWPRTRLQEGRVVVHATVLHPILSNANQYSGFCVTVLFQCERDDTGSHGGCVF